MAETNSAQAARVQAGGKILFSEHGRIHTAVITTPAVFAQMAINDTLATKQYIPRGSRIVNARVSNGTGTASSTFNLGLRKRDGTVISATAISSAIAITTATTNPVAAGNGGYIAAGVDQLLADDAEIYLTATGAVLAANQHVRVEVDYIPVG